MEAHEVKHDQISTERPKPARKLKMKTGQRKTNHNINNEEKQRAPQLKYEVYKKRLPRTHTLFLDSASSFVYSCTHFSTIFQAFTIYCLSLYVVCVSVCLKLACTYNAHICITFGCLCYEHEQAETYYTYVRTIPNEWTLYDTLFRTEVWALKSIPNSMGMIAISIFRICYRKEDGKNRTNE